MNHVPAHDQRAHGPVARTLAIGFGVVAVMWAIAYVSLMSPGLAVGEMLFIILLLCLVAGGALAGFHSAPPLPHAAPPAARAGARGGALVGLVAATLNLLIVGSLLIDPDTHALRPEAPLWIAGNFAVSIALAGLGGFIGGRWGKRERSTSPPHDQRPVNWHYWFTIIAAATVLLLLLTGGLVTGHEAGLAVPDWPTSFGHNMLLYPLREMQGGIAIEHAHRLYGMLVGVTAIALAASTFAFDARLWMRGLGVAYLVMVIVQGLAGGFRVTETNIALAIAHGVFGQLVLCTIAAIAAFASPTWRSGATVAAPGNRASSDRTLSTLLVIALIVQLALGATYRHLRHDMDQPPQPLHVLYAHIAMAAAVTALAIIAGGRAWGRHRQEAMATPVLPHLGGLVLAIVGVQLMLGVGSMIVVFSRGEARVIPRAEIVITSAHQITGALLLVASVLLLAWTRRLLRGR